MQRVYRRERAERPRDPVVRIIDRLNGGFANRLKRKVAGPFAALSEWLDKRAGSRAIFSRIARRVKRVCASGPRWIDVFEPDDALERSVGRRFLLVSHDLSLSGAPRIVVEICRMLVDRGDEVAVLTGLDGQRRAELLAIGATVIVDPAIGDPDAPLPGRIAGAFAAALCNTVATHACAVALASRVPTVLYTHETTLVDELLATSPSLRLALTETAEVWAGSELSASRVRPIRPNVVTMPYGLRPLTDRHRDCAPLGTREPIWFSVFGSIEPRKGQDMLVEAVARLDPMLRKRLRVRLHGRVVDEAFNAALRRRVAAVPEISLNGELDAAEYRQMLLDSDAVVVPSRSDTLPLVSLDALGACRLLICTRSTGTSAYVVQGESGFIAEQACAQTLAATLTLAMERLDAWPSIAAAGQAVFARHFSREAFGTAVLARLDALTAGAQRA